MGKRTISTLYLKLFFIILFFIYRPLSAIFSQIYRTPKYCHKTETETYLFKTSFMTKFAAKVILFSIS